MVDFLLWVASYGKIRKDELFGFLDFVLPKRVAEFEKMFQALVSDDVIEVGQYQKISLVAAVAQEDLVQEGILEAVKLGIPPLLFAAFLRNQGIANVHEYLFTVDELVNDHILTSSGTGLMHVAPRGTHEVYA